MKCGLCGGPLTVLGKLGAWIHFRCRNCGLTVTLNEAETDNTNRSN